MLLAKNRLKKGKDFDCVYRKGRSALFDGILIKFLENGRRESRIGFSVGVKFSKKAVLRNKIKRQMRAIMREKLKSLKKGFDIVVIPQKVEIGEQHEKIEGKIRKTLEKGNLIIKN